MKHVVEFKIPKFFGKKKIEEVEIEPELVTEENMNKLSTVMTIAAPLVIGLALGYTVGFNRGAVKVLNGIIIVAK